LLLLFSSSDLADNSAPSTLVPTILLVEDNASDRDLMRTAWEEAGYEARFEEAVDFYSALERLRRLADDPMLERPGLILLDLNLPGGNGKDILSYLKGTAELHDLPVVVLTTSSDNKDRAECLELGAHDYEVKPSIFSDLIDCAHRIHAVMEARGQGQ
jgi:CheY-like chemotaxis protein